MTGKQLPRLSIAGDRRIAHVHHRVLDVGVPQPILHECHIRTGVQVTTPGGNTVLANAFTYTSTTSPAPTLTSVQPASGPTGGGTPVCSLRIAVNTRRRDETGQWGDKPNYFSVSVFGNQAESCSQYLSKGRPVGIDGRLEWREWDATDGSGKRQAVEVIAESVQFLGSRGDTGGDTPQFVPAGAAGDSADFTSSAADDDIPF